MGPRTGAEDGSAFWERFQVVPTEPTLTIPATGTQTAALEDKSSEAPEAEAEAEEGGGKASAKAAKAAGKAVGKAKAAGKAKATGKAKASPKAAGGATSAASSAAAGGNEAGDVDPTAPTRAKAEASGAETVAESAGATPPVVKTEPGAIQAVAHADASANKFGDKTYAARWARFQRSLSGTTERTARQQKCPSHISMKIRSAGPKDAKSWFELYSSSNCDWAQVEVAIQVIEREKNSTEMANQWYSDMSELVALCN